MTFLQKSATIIYLVKVVKCVIFWFSYLWTAQIHISLVYQGRDQGTEEDDKQTFISFIAL